MPKLESFEVVLVYCNLVNNNYRKSIESLWHYCRDEPNDFPANNYNGNPITNPESFKYKNNIRIC